MLDPDIEPAKRWSVVATVEVFVTAQDRATAQAKALAAFEHYAMHVVVPPMALPAILPSGAQGRNSS